MVFILADDVGYGGIHCNGTDWIETPRIDRLAAEGVRFTNGYSSHPTCQPSRIAILSGQYAPRTGGYRVMDHHRGKEHLIWPVCRARKVTFSTVKAQQPVKEVVRRETEGLSPRSRREIAGECGHSSRSHNAEIGLKTPSKQDSTSLTGC